jgi:2-iminobutanoate/2-iminopropanoate deaminase
MLQEPLAHTGREKLSFTKLAFCLFLSLSHKTSQAIKYGGVTYVSGCIGLNKETGALVHGGIVEETRQALENLKSIVVASGSDLSRVLKTTVLLADMQYFKEVNAIYAEYFPFEPPARATFAVLGLPAGALIEIECVCADSN